jgi:hypothetical protein
MKQSNLARRIEPVEVAGAEDRPRPVQPPASDETAARIRPRASFARRTIQIRDQGLAPFRVR